MNTEETRSVVLAFLDAKQAGNAVAMLATLAADAVWTPPASSGLGPFRGREEVVAARSGGAAGQFLDLSTIGRKVHKWIVEGDTAVILQQVSARTLTGHDYSNEYCWVYTCADGVIVNIDEYSDTQAAARVFGAS